MLDVDCDSLSLTMASLSLQILDVKQCLVAVNWLCRNPQAPQSSDSAAWDRPKRFWTDLDQLTLVHAAA